MATSIFAPWALTWALALVAPQEPLCRLWSHRGMHDALGQPIVHVGIVSQPSRIELFARAPLLVSLREHDTPTEIEVPRGARVVIEQRAPPLPVASPSKDCPVPYRGELLLWVDGMALGTAQDLVELRPQDPEQPAIEVPDVPFGMGYSWGGVARRRYRGEMLVTYTRDGTLIAINQVPTEALLLGVVPSEMPSQGPLEALKAQAIAARNFVVTGMGRLHRAEPIDFCAEQHCQVYGGAGDEAARSTQAVQETRGEVLYLQDRPVSAKYSARCGGHTENNEVVWLEPADVALRGRSDVRATPGMPPRAGYTPPLAALMTPHTQAWCDDPTAQAAWHITRTAAELLLTLGEAGRRIAPITDIAGVGRGPGHRLKKLVVTGEHGQLVIARELPIRRALGQLRSAAITLAPQHDANGRLRSVTIRGIGWGHGVGMCQQGAMARARAGQSCGSILGHYYARARVRAVWSDAVRGCP